MRGAFRSLFVTVTSTTPSTVALLPLTDATARLTILPDDAARAVLSADANAGLLVRRSCSGAWLRNKNTDSARKPMIRTDSAIAIQALFGLRCVPSLSSWGIGAG